MRCGARPDMAGALCKRPAPQAHACDTKCHRAIPMLADWRRARAKAPQQLKVDNHYLTFRNNIRLTETYNNN